MIPNVTRGGKTHGVLLYLVGKGKREEHQNPHLVAGSPEAIRMGEGRLLERSDAIALARFLDEPREAFGTQVTIAERDKNGRVTGARDAHVWHCSLSLHPQEPELADERWAEICEQFIEQMRFAGETARRSAGGSRSATAAPPAAPTTPTWSSRSWRRTAARRASTTTARAPRRRAGSSSSASGCGGWRRAPAQAGSRGLKHGELAADRRRGRQLGDRGEHPERSSRQTLERIVRACATASRDESEFIRRLRDEGDPLRPRYAEGGTDKVVGYSVRLPGAEEGPRRSVWYGGGRLARDLTLPALRRSWGQDEQARAAAGGRRVELVDAGEAAVAGRAPGRARAARADVAPLHDGARARPPAAPRRRQRPRRDRARRPRGRRRARRLVARARRRAARRARPRRPPARPLRRAARPHARAAEDALARVRAGAVHARRRQARQRRSDG